MTATAAMTLTSSSATTATTNASVASNNLLGNATPSALMQDSLYNSNVCRLCAEDNVNGELLYHPNPGEQKETDLSVMVNRYLPLKIRDDGKLPRTICPGCNIQLEATVQFFELLVDGQRKIREMWKQQVEQRRKFEKERLRLEREGTEMANDTSELDLVQANEEEQQLEREIIIKILPDGSMYAADHEMSLQMEGLSKPRRKRGRPPKSQETKDLTREDVADGAGGGSQGEDDGKQEDELEEIDGDGRRRRKRKVPKRYMEAVQGKELERMFKEEGVIDEEDDDKSDNLEEREENVDASAGDNQEEVIGHLETEEGKDLGELVVVNRARGRGRPKVGRRKNKFTCQLCGRGFLQRSRYVVHKSFHNKGTKLECSSCKRQFTNKENFALHQKMTGHTGESLSESGDTTNATSEDGRLADPEEKGSDLGAVYGQNELPLENGELDDGSEDKNVDKTRDPMMDSGALDAADAVEVPCEVCEASFASKEALQAHAKETHSEDDKTLTCKVCDKTFASQSLLKTHVSTHEVNNKSEKGYPCDICGKVLNHPSSVVYHREAEHNNGRRFVCNKCGKSFKHKQLLQRHQLVHSDDRPYVCKSCNASFKTKANLINHQSTHTGEKKYFCEICGQQFAHKTSLTLHYRWHTGYKPYTCDVCNKSFSQNGNLQEHMRIHTGEKPYCCDYCGRKFTTSSQFKLHVKRHTGERPWKCEFCAKCFLHKDTWKCHVRRHKGERPFQCAHCNRGFTEQWALKKHLRLHTGEKPYTCDVCGKAFADCSNLTKHKKVHRESQAVVGEGDVVAPAAAIGEVWQILPAATAQEVDDNSLGDQVAQVIATTNNPDDASEDGIQQIIYVSYQDPDDPNQSRTLHFVDAGLMATRKEKQQPATSVATTTSGSAVPTSMVKTSDDMLVDDEEVQPSAAIDQTGEDDRIDVELTESDLQLQITDEAGNPIPLSIQDARQLLSEGQFVRVHSSVIGQDLAESLNRHHRAVEMVRVVDDASQERLENPETSVTMQNSATSTDAEAIVKVLEDEDTDATAVATINQLGGATGENDAEAGLVDEGQAIEFTTQDGQKVRLVTSYHVDPMQLASEYLTIV